MCFGAPAPPPPIPQRQAAQAPDASFTAARAASLAASRQGYAASILTPMGGPGAAMTTGGSLTGSGGKTLLGG